MQRVHLEELARWVGSEGRRPLVLRGARQVGKTWLVRELAEHLERELVEVNLERDPRLAATLLTRPPARALADLGLLLDVEVDPARHLLFLDEVQAAPEVLGALRWVWEDLPALPVVAAGSLLEFALGELQGGVPVGRLSYRYLEPLGFDEYLRAHGQAALLERLSAWRVGEPLAEVVHTRASELYERFAQVGGMPAVVAADIAGESPAELRRRQTDLVATFRDDFVGYAPRMEASVLDAVLSAVARLIGQKFIYARVTDGVKQHQVKGALERLAMARVVTLAPHSSGNGVPLRGEANEKHRKAFLLDVGLFHALLRTPAGAAFPRLASLAASVRGQLAEQLAAQELRCLDRASGAEAELHHWQRSGGRVGEIDFLLQIDLRLVPVEVKAGAAGAMKSLHQFVHDKGLGLGVRVDTNPPSLQTLDVRTTQGDPARYTLLSVPGYLLHRLQDLVRQL